MEGGGDLGRAVPECRHIGCVVSHGAAALSCCLVLCYAVLCCVVLSGIGFCLFDFCSLDHMMMMMMMMMISHLAHMFVIFCYHVQLILAQ